MDAVSVRRSESVANLAAALCKAQAEVKAPAKNKQNPHLKNWYADLAAVAEAVLPAFLRHGLAVTQLPCELGGDPAVMTLVLHTSGEWLETVARTRPVKTDPQGTGSALTYAKRYALQSLAGVVAEDDDDGHAASHRPAQQTPRQQPPHDAEVRSARPPDGAEVDNAGAVAQAVAAYEACQTPTDVDIADDRILTLKNEKRLTDKDITAIRPAARAAHARLKPKPAKA